MGLGVPCTVQKSLTGVFSHTVWGRRATIKSGILPISSRWSDFLNIFSFTWRDRESYTNINEKKIHLLNLDGYGSKNIEFLFLYVSWILNIFIKTGKISPYIAVIVPYTWAKYSNHTVDCLLLLSWFHHWGVTGSPLFPKPDCPPEPWWPSSSGGAPPWSHSVPSPHSSPLAGTPPFLQQSWWHPYINDLVWS